jgi:hypothetical protein
MYVIVTVPPETAVTRPPALTVATAGFEVDHGVVPSGVPDPVNKTVELTHKGVAPEIVGIGFTSTVKNTSEAQAPFSSYA